MTAITAAAARNRWRGLGRQPWLCAHSIPASPRHARMSPVYRIAIARMLSLFSDGSTESGSLMGSVALFGAVAPTTMPSRRPTPAKLTATLGSDSLLQASLRITVLMTR
jgi:hypothetical protein